MCIFKEITDFLSFPKSPPTAPEPLTENPRWALAAGAQWTVLNRDRHDTLNPDPDETQGNWVNARERCWGIENYDAVNMLQSLKRSGHRVTFRSPVGHHVLAWVLVG